MPIVKHIDGLAAVVPSDPMVTAGNIPGSFLDLVSFLVFPIMPGAAECAYCVTDFLDAWVWIPPPRATGC